MMQYRDRADEDPAAGIRSDVWTGGLMRNLKEWKGLVRVRIAGLWRWYGRRDGLQDVVMNLMPALDLLTSNIRPYGPYGLNDSIAPLFVIEACLNSAACS